MKKSILILTLLFFTLLPASAIKRIEANPVNIAFSLCKETDSSKIDSTLEYYGYEPQTSSDGYTVYRHSNGSVIRYNFQDASETQPFPYVEVKSNRGSSDVENALTNLDFKKKRIGIYSESWTTCSHRNKMQPYPSRISCIPPYKNSTPIINKATDKSGSSFIFHIHTYSTSGLPSLFFYCKSIPFFYKSEEPL